MAAGWIPPDSAVPVTAGFVFPNIHVGAGANSKYDRGLGVTDATTLTTDATWALRFPIPPELPTGTLKLRILSLANASTGNLVVNPQWASTAPSEDPSVISLNAEGNTTITFTAVDDYKETKITLDADTPVVNEILVMNLVIVNSGTTVAVTTTHRVYIGWE